MLSNLFCFLCLFVADCRNCFSGLLPALAVLDHDVDALQQIDVAQHVAADGDDVGVLAWRDGADLSDTFIATDGQ